MISRKGNRTDLPMLLSIEIFSREGDCRGSLKNRNQKKQGGRNRGDAIIQGG
jgi:hypothetical protein